MAEEVDRHLLRAQATGVLDPGGDPGSSIGMVAMRVLLRCPALEWQLDQHHDEIMAAVGSRRGTKAACAAMRMGWLMLLGSPAPNHRIGARDWCGELQPPSPPVSPGATRGP